LSLFKVVYVLNPLGPLDLIPRPLDQKPSVEAEQRVAEIKKLHEQVRARIEKSNISYEPQANKHRKLKVFQPGDYYGFILEKRDFHQNERPN